MIVVIQDLSTGGGERIMRDFLQEVRTNVTLYSSETVESPYVQYCPTYNWNTLSLILLALKILTLTNRKRPIIVVLTKPCIIFGMLNIMFKKRIFLYEHSDPFLLYLNRAGFLNRFKAKLFRLAFKNNKNIVVTDIIKRKLIKILYFKNRNVSVLKNPCAAITTKLSNIRLEPRKAMKTYIIIGRDSAEKRLDDAINFYKDQLETSESSLWIVTKTTRKLNCADQQFDDYCALNNYVIANNIFYKPILINFSVSESFSLVIAEFLSAKLEVISVYSELLDELWSKYAGFTFIGRQITNGTPKSTYVPLSHTEYDLELLQILDRD